MVKNFLNILVHRVWKLTKSAANRSQFTKATLPLFLISDQVDKSSKLEKTIVIQVTRDLLPL